MMHEVALFEEMKRKEKSFCPWTFRKGLLEEKGLKTGQKEVAKNIEPYSV